MNGIHVSLDVYVVYTNKNMLVSQLKTELTKLTREIIEGNEKAFEIDDGK